MPGQYEFDLYFLEEVRLYTNNFNYVLYAESVISYIKNNPGIDNV